MALKPSYRCKWWTTSEKEICNVDFICNCCGDKNCFEIEYKITYYLPNSKTVYNIIYLQNKMNEINNDNSKLRWNQTLYN